MSIFIGSSVGETIEPGSVSSSVAVIGNPKAPSAAADLIFAGSGNDRVAGGGGSDIVFLGAGDDLFTWNSGDGSDFVDGGSGIDTLAFNGSAAAETIRLSTGILGTLRVSDNVENINLTLTGMERVVVRAGLGNDVVDASALPAGRATLEIFGGDGNDLLIGSAGNDTFVWNPGDDNDTIEGRAGLDTLLFNGANIGESINVLANGTRVLFTRDIANVTMDLNQVERIDFNALGGADKVTIHDLAGTGAVEVNVNLAAILGGSSGDGAADQVIVNGTAGDDTIQASASGTSASVLGLAAVTNVSNLETIDQLIVDGQGGNDTLIGGAGSQILHGGEGDDVLRGGDGDDQMFGDAGNDRMVWNPSDDTDLMEGGDDIDTAEVNAGNAAEIFTVTANGTRVRFDRLEPGPFSLDIGTTENLVVNMNGGDDQFSATGNLASLIKITVDGGAGNDTILGSNGIDTLIGGEGNDFIDGQQGTDSAFMGAGEDTFQWDPGDGSDMVEGGAGFDRLLFNGSAIAETFDVSANGERATLFRNIGNITMDLNDIERIDLRALAGADSVQVHDLSGTDVVEVNLDLGAVGGGGDGAIDHVLVEGTDGNDLIEVVDGGASIVVSGLPARVQIDNAEAQDVLAIDAGDGDDTLLLNGANIAENVDIAANGERATVSRNTGNVTLELGGIETIHFSALEGADSIVVSDLSGTAVEEVVIDLAGPGGAPDGGADRVTVNGTNGDDAISLSSLDEGVAVVGLQAQVSIDNVEAQDTLVINALDGDDVVNASQLGADQMNLSLNGGRGEDILIGSEGDDFFNGGDGNDTALMGGGDDTFVWNPGDDNDTLDGQAGFDTLHFNGANIAETVDIFADGGRAALTRDIANIAMDADDVERFDFNALGGADKVTVHDLSGTDVVEVNVNLAATLGGSAGDGAADLVTVDATSADDVIVIAGDAGGVSVLGLSAQVNVTGADAGDRLQVHAGDGDDVIEASGVAAGSIGLVLDGGAGDDIIVGSAGDDVLVGGEGDDVLIGGGGNDVFDFGPGNDTVIQDFTSGEDKLNLRAFAGANDLEWVLAHARDVGGDTVLDLGDGGEVTLTHVDVAALQIDDFLF